jgi:hypothetical protein
MLSEPGIQEGRHFDAVTAPMMTAYRTCPVRRGYLGQRQVRGPVGDLMVEPAEPARLIAFGTLSERGHITVPGHSPILALRPSRSTLVSGRPFHARNVPQRGTVRTRPSAARLRRTRVTVACETP